MRDVFFINAKRTAVAPRGTALRDYEAPQLASATIEALLTDAGCAPNRVQAVFMGNALYGGGNPARVAALAAGIPDRVEAMTIDTQCCSGLDAVMLGAVHVASGLADIVIAGGLESYSRAPIRMRRPRDASEQPEAYLRPPFTPWADRDPDMIASAALVARELKISRAQQEAFAIAAHRRALAARARKSEIVPLGGLHADAFTRPLSQRLCDRLPVIAGDGEYGQTTATIAVEADAAAAVLMVSENALKLMALTGHPIRYRAGKRGGDDPTRPALAPIRVTRQLLRAEAIDASGLAVAEVMEAFAVQAMACIEGIGLGNACVNRSGGALARGHPIGASGAILAVRLWHELQAEKAGATGLAVIAAAGGLGSALLLQRCD